LLSPWILHFEDQTAAMQNSVAGVGPAAATDFVVVGLW
jgi:hypothetical protein